MPLERGRSRKRADPSSTWDDRRQPQIELNIGAPSEDLSSKIKPRLDRETSGGFLRSASAGAKLSGGLETYLLIPKNLAPLDGWRVARPPVAC